MVLDFLANLIEQRDLMPNKFTIGIGKLIRKAREESDFSHSGIAQRTYRTQASLSDIENGKMQPDAETLLLLALNLSKPISYFFPRPYGDRVRLEFINPLEQELLMQSQRLNNDDLRRLIAQARALAELKIE